MAQTGYTPIQLYHSTTALSVPLAADLEPGELALNITDGKLYYKNNAGSIQLLTSAGSGGGTVTSVSGTGTVNGLTLTGTVTSTGSLTLGGTLSNVSLATQVTGNLQVTSLNGGSGASASTFWRGDGTWAVPAGSGGGVTAVNAVFPITVTGTTTPTIGIASSVGNPVTTTSGSGALMFNVSPTLVTPFLVAPALGQPLSGNFSTGSFTWPTFNQNTTGNAATATAPASGGSFITSSNIGSQSVGFASSAGSASSAGGLFGSPAITVTSVSAPSGVTVSSGGFSSILSNQSLQVGASGVGVVYDNSSGGISIGRSAGTNLTCFSAFIYSNTDNTQRPTGGPWLSISDERVKENITTYTKGLNALNQLRPVNYTLKGKLGEATNYKTCTGLIAQEVLNTPLESMLKLDASGYYTLDANEVTWTLVNAVKELKAELDTAKAEIAALKAK